MKTKVIIVYYDMRKKYDLTFTEAQELESRTRLDAKHHAENARKTRMNRFKEE